MKNYFFSSNRYGESFVVMAIGQEEAIKAIIKHLKTMEGYTNSREDILQGYEIIERGINEVIEIEHY